MSQPTNPPQLPGPPTLCPQCGEQVCVDEWQCQRDYRSSETTWRRRYGNGPSVMWRGGRVEVTQ